MVNYNKLMEKLKEKDITTYAIRKYNLFGQEILRKFKMCSEQMKKSKRLYRNTKKNMEYNFWRKK